MNSYSNQLQENENQKALNVTQKRNNNNVAAEFSDQRPATVAQMQLQEIANNSEQVKQATQLQIMANTNSTLPVQKKGVEEEELQMKVAPAFQFVDNRSESVVQKAKWVKELGRFKIYNDDKTTRKPKDDEEIENPQSSDKWRPGCIFDDSENKWYESDENGALKDREEIGQLLVTPLGISKYDDGIDHNFGHKFNFSVWMNAKSIEWNEKTDKPYEEEMEENIWLDLYPIYKDKSDVFKFSKNIKEYDSEYIFNDPPGILHKPNNKRKLEFELKFKDKKDKEEVITAEQNLATDGDGNITTQEFTQK